MQMPHRRLGRTIEVWLATAHPVYSHVTGWLARAQPPCLAKGTHTMARILIVEDEANIFKLVSFRLKHLGHEVLWAQNGQQGLAIAHAERPDLILLDVVIPVLNGFEVLKKLRADAQTQPIPVIMLTARGYEKDVVAGIESGADDYIVKPFNFPELVARLNAVLERRSQ